MTIDELMKIISGYKTQLELFGYQLPSIHIGCRDDTTNGPWFDGYVSWYGAGRGFMYSGDNLGSVLDKIGSSIRAMPLASEAQKLTEDTIKMAKAAIPADRANLIEIHAAY